VSVRRLNRPVQTVLLRALIAAFPLGYGLFSLVQGQDANWDLRNYHYFGPWWVFSNHMVDYAPAHYQTYINPLLDTPFYWLAGHVSGRIVGLVVGTCTGLSFPFIYLIGREVLQSRWLALTLAALGMFTAGTLSEAGTIMGDSLTAPLYLCAVWLVLRSVGSLTQPSRRTVATLVTAGVVAGAATALKTAGAPWLIGLVATMFILSGHWHQRVVSALSVALGAALGFFGAYGWWGWTMWTHFGNPLLPFFNGVFKSPWVPPLPMGTSYTSVPHSIVELLFYPLVWTIDPTRVSELPLRELTIPFVELLLLALVARTFLRLARRRSWAPFFSEEKPRCLVAWAVIGYLPWAVVFGYYRFLMPLEMVSFVIMIVLLRELWPSALLRWRPFAATSLVLASVLTMVSPDWGRVAFASRYFSVPVPSQFSRHPSAVLIIGDEPVAYVIPSFPPTTYFAWVQGYALPTPLAHASIEDHLKSYQALYVMWTFPYATAADYLAPRVRILAGYGLHADITTCRTINAMIGASVVEPIHYCDLARGAS
jgi:hypothetical protein